MYHIGNTSNLYISEELGVSYSLTLQDIVSPPEKDWVDGNPTIDVHVVREYVNMCLLLVWDEFRHTVRTGYSKYRLLV